MAYAYTTCDHRDCRLFTAQFMQTSATTRDQHVDVFIHTQHFTDQRTVRIINRLHGTRR
ncbi:Uncharacterised protein [Shigella flexneri]|nr:Uncharacterised protein [Shigella flexneri]